MTDFNEPQSLTEEAEAQGIEIMETGTDQITVDPDIGDPLLQGKSGEENNETNDSGNEDEADASDVQDRNEDEGTPEEDLQKEVDKHEKAINAVKTSLKEKGVDFNKAVREYQESGKLSDETVAELEKAGYPSEVIEGFIESRKALESRFTEAVYDSVGGTKEYNRIVDWASKNLPQKTIDSFNRAIDNNNLEAVSLMLEGMKSKMTSKMGTANKSIHGGTATPVNRPKGFANKSEVIEAMSDKRYGRDPEYTRQVEQRMWATSV